MMNQRVAVVLLAVSWPSIAVLHAQQSASRLEPDGFHTFDKRASNLVRVDPNANWARYRAYQLAPAVYEPSSSRYALKPGEVRKVESTVDSSLQRSFMSSNRAEGPVLEVRPVITRFKRTNTLLNILGFAAVQAPISFGAASVRYELFDTASGARVGVISCQRKARPWNVYPWNALYNFEALGQGSVILKSDSRRLRKDLDRLGKLRPGQDQAAVSGAE
jgi:hypothetical protein